MRQRDPNGLATSKQTNMELFRRVGLDLMLAHRCKGKPDFMVIEFLKSILPQVDDDTKQKIENVIRLINERTTKRHFKELERPKVKR